MNLYELTAALRERKRTGDYSGARLLFETWLSESQDRSQHVWAAIALATFAITECLFDEAIDDCRRCIELVPEDGYPHSLLGLVFRLRGDYDRAESEYRQAIALKESEGSACCYTEVTDFGSLLLDLGRYDECERWCLADWDLPLDQVYPGEVAIAHRLEVIARLHRSRGRYDEAIDFYRRSIRLYCSSRMLIRLPVLLAPLASVLLENEALNRSADDLQTRSKLGDEGGRPAKGSQA